MCAHVVTVRSDTRKCAAISLWVMMVFCVLVIVVVVSMSAVLVLAWKGMRFTSTVTFSVTWGGREFEVCQRLWKKRINSIPGNCLYLAFATGLQRGFEEKEGVFLLSRTQGRCNPVANLKFAGKKMS